MVSVSRDAGKPMIEQLRDQLAAAIAAGELAPGKRLPSTRQLCQRLGVNRATVVEAYRRLTQDGLIEMRRGSGAYVAAPRPASAAWRAPVSRPVAEPRPELPEGALDLASLSPGEADHPTEVFNQALRKVMSERGGAALAYGPTLGDARLRELLAERLRRRWLAVSPSEVLIVGGAQQGLDLIFRACMTAGHGVVTEAPSYHLALDLLRFHGARIAGVPLRRTAPGFSTLDFGAFERELDRRDVALAYVMPTFQNPTGLTLEPSARRRLAASCREAGVLLVEDDYEADMADAGGRVAPIASLPEAGAVAYVGTLSKALFPGLRVGWVVAGPELLERLAMVKRISDLSGALLLQAVAADLLESGAYDRHVEQAAVATSRKRAALVAALEGALPEGCSVTAPRGGHVLWLEAPVASGRALAERALREGVAVTPGESFQPTGVGAGVAGARVSIARLLDADVEEAAARLVRATAACIEEGRSRPALRADMERPVQV